MALKSKVHVTQNWPNLEKRPPFLQFLTKISEIILVKDLTNQVLFSFELWEHIFFARMHGPKHGRPLSAPLWPIFIILSIVTTILDR